MLSTFPATFSADTFLGNPFPPFESGIPPWEYQEPSFLFPQLDEPVAFSPHFSQEPVNSNSGSDTQNPSPSSGSDETNQDETKTLSHDRSEPNRDNFKNKRPGSNEASRLDSSTTEERKRRRMISNRESARRSRMRKQRHLDNLRNQANRLKGGNREQTDRLRMVVHQTQLIRRENECLRSEALMLRQRLWDIRQVLVVRQLQQLYPTAMH